MLYGRHIDSVGAITVETPKDKWSFKLIGEKENLEVFYNEKQIEAKNFRNFYIELLSIQTEGIWPDYANLNISELEQIMKVTMETKTGDTEIIAFYKLEDRRLLYTIDGMGVFYVISNKVDKFVENCRRVANREAVIPTW